MWLSFAPPPTGYLSGPANVIDVAKHMMASLMYSAPACGCSASSWAATPDTIGHAIEVPEARRVAVLLVEVADMMLVPGAWMSTHEPQLEKTERTSWTGLEKSSGSFTYVAPTERTIGSFAG